MHQIIFTTSCRSQSSYTLRLPYLERQKEKNKTSLKRIRFFTKYTIIKWSESQSFQSRTYNSAFKSLVRFLCSSTIKHQAMLWCYSAQLDRYWTMFVYWKSITHEINNTHLLPNDSRLSALQTQDKFNIWQHSGNILHPLSSLSQESRMLAN